MARLIPKIDPSEIENPGERMVAKALVNQLASRVEVFHSFNWLGANKRGTLFEGECDFVVLDLNNGMLFVEVKGGSLEFDPVSMEWLRVLPNGERRVIVKDPFMQVRKSMHEIMERVKKELTFEENQMPFTFGYAVAFPDCHYTGALPASISPDLVLDALKCQDLQASVQRVFDRFRQQTQPEFIQARSLHEGFAKAGKQVREWCMPGAGGLRTSQVAVLASGSSEQEWPSDFQPVLATRNFNQWRKNKGVLLSSWSRFKGLEADAIVVLETPFPDGGRENVNRYVARSRAKHLLTVIQVEEA